MPAPNLAKDYDARIHRAEHLAGVHPFAREVLTFYRRIAEFQKSTYTRFLTGSKSPVVERPRLFLPL
jgi:formate dehydrogenase maturation protein FdhE